MAKPTVNLAAAVELATRGLKAKGAASTKGGGREGLVGVMLHVDPGLRRRLRQLALNEDTTLQALGVEALEALLASRRGA